MSAHRPSLDDLIRTQRSAVGMTSAQRAVNRARLTSRVLAQSVATAGAGAAASTAGIAWASATGWLAKAALGLALVGGVGAAYQQANPAASADATSRQAQQQTQPVQPVSASPAAVPVPSESGAPTAESPATAVPAARAPKVSTAVSATPPVSLAVEVQLMRDIDSALKSGHPGRALALLDERREGDGGYMQEERAAARIFALCQLGRVESARSAAERFVRARPRSPLAARVKGTCAASAATGTTGKLP